MKFLIALPLIVTALNVNASTCDDVYGSHKIQIEGRSIYLSYYATGTIDVSDKKGNEAYYINNHMSGGVLGNKTYAPLVWKPVMSVKDGVDKAQDWLHGENNFRDIQLFRNEDHPIFAKNIAKKFLKKINSLEPEDEGSELILACIELRLNEILK